MISRMRIGLLVLLCVGLVGTAIGLRGQAQVAPVPLGGPDARIISGDDFGFRIDGRGPDGRLTGTLMVRIQGQWMPIGGAGTYPLTSR
jgi:hypothetical protein